MKNLFFLLLFASPLLGTGNTPILFEKDKKIAQPASSGVASLPPLAKPILEFPAHAIDLLPYWKKVWRVIEDRILGVYRDAVFPHDPASIAHTSKTIEQNKGKVPEIHQIMTGFMAGHIPMPDELLKYVFTADFQDQLKATITRTDDAITKLLIPNAKKFHDFRELVRKGTAWPHSPERRSLWDAGGFVRRPMMNKRDRMICQRCGVEVADIESWMYPQYYHIAAKHPAGYLESLTFNGVPLIRETYGENIPPDDGTRALVEYLMRHIDLYARNLANRSMKAEAEGVDSNLDKQAVELAKLWLETRSAAATKATGWNHCTRYIQDPDAYKKNPNG